MYKYFKKNWAVLVTLLVVIFLWVGINQESEQNKGDFQGSLPDLKLSSLPADLEESLTQIKKRAEAKQKELAYKFFDFNFVKKNEGNKIITSDIPLILETNYSSSEQVVKNITSMPEPFIGLTVNQIEDILHEWEVKEFTSNRALVLTREKPGFPPLTSGGRYLGVKDGRVAIYNGNMEVLQLTEIKIEDLPVQERESLRNGIKVETKEELLTILEGLISINTD